MEFTREDTPTIMDGAVVRYRCGDFEINASRNGVSTNGFMPMIRQQEDLDTVCEYMRRAFRQYVALSPNRWLTRSYASPLPESVFEAVEHSLHPTSETLPDLQASSTPEHSATSQSES